MENDPLTILIKDFTQEMRESERVRRIQVRNSYTKRKPRIPRHLAMLWSDWNAKSPGAGDRLAEAFGNYFRGECLQEWNRLTNPTL